MMTLSNCKTEKIETSVLKVDLEIKESEKKIWINLELQYIWNIIKLQRVYSI